MALWTGASADATKHALIMDSFEQRLNLNHESMSKIEEYDKMMAAMDTGNNGGPALETTFPTWHSGRPHFFNAYLQFWRRHV